MNAGARLLADVRRDLQDVLQVCVGDKKPTNHHRMMMADLAKGEFHKKPTNDDAAGSR